ncbi:MAG TPA: tetratricopeptide repeat protein [Candidatus Kapabacteria bacterium]|nr:tetratricopeptide repeat protein [Candidatus Kapabacteria bacterium]
MSKKKTKLVPPEENPPFRALLDQAQELLGNDKYAQAEQIASEVLVHLNEIDTQPSSDKAYALCILGRSCWCTYRYDESLTHCLNAAAAAEAVSDPRLQCRALCAIADIHGHRDDYITALQLTEHALALADQSRDKKEQCRALGAVGFVHEALNDYPRALEHYTRLLAMAQEIGERRREATALTGIGLVHSVLADYPRAIDFGLRALALYEEIDSKWDVVVALGSLANTFHGIADYPRALDYNIRALAVVEDIGDKLGTGRALANIGCLFADIGDYPRSFDYLARALALNEEVGDKTGTSMSLGDIGLSYLETGDLPRAFEYLNRALKLSEEIGERRTTVHWLMALAKTQHKMGDLEGAHRGFLNVLHQFREILETSEGVAVALIELGRVSIEQAKQEEALQWLEEAQRVANQTGEKQLASDAHREMSGLFAKNGDMASAYEHIMKHNAIEKEIHTEELKKRIDLFNMRVAVSEIEHGVEVQKLRIEHMEHDLANSAIQLSAQTDLLDHFRNDLRQIFREMDEPIAAMKRIKEKLKELPYVEINWEKFEAQFIAVHPDFKAKLEAKYPTLTPQEVRMCSLVRVGLRNPEIAKLLCLSERTLENHRFNIRKKFSIKTERSLHDFLSKSI